MVVTTTPSPPPAARARAQVVAERCGLRVAARGRFSLARLMRNQNADAVYVIGREMEQVVAPGTSLHANPGMYYLKVEDGDGHPLIRAVQPRRAAKVRDVLDATLGMAGDALHLAGTLGVSVQGVEASPVLVSLVEEGLTRMSHAAHRRYSDAAARVSVQHGDAAAVLSALPDAAVDVVYLDPMFEVPQTAHTSFSLVRRFADARPLSETLITEAARVARRRVVLKVGAMAPVPESSAGPGWNRRVRGRAVDYLVIERELSRADCEWEAPTPGEPDERARG